MKTKPTITLRAFLATIALSALLSGCSNMSANPDVAVKDDKIVKDEYYGPGGMSQYKKDKDREAALLKKEACQNAQIDLVEAKSVNDVALIEQIQRKISKVCAGVLKK